MKQFLLFATIFFISGSLFAQTTTYLGADASAGTNVGTSGTHSAYFGYRTGIISTAYASTFVGSYAGLSNSTGNYNSFFGHAAGRNNTKAQGNSFFGGFAGHRNTTGSYNSFIGLTSGFYNTTGQYNTAVGTFSNFTNSTGSGNVSMGYSAGYTNTTGNFNVALGTRAGHYNQTGSGNVFLGNQAGYNEINSNKLHIANTDKKTLIYGDFFNDYVGIAINPAVDLPVSPGNYGLYVGKGILTEKVQVALRGTPNWADYVFEEDYDLNTTDEVEEFIKENKHLPNVPSAQEVAEKGVDMVEMDATLLRQIEELWLHVIDMKKENKELKEQVQQLKNQK